MTSNAWKQLSLYLKCPDVPRTLQLPENTCRLTWVDADKKPPTRPSIRSPFARGRVLQGLVHRLAFHGFPRVDHLPHVRNALEAGRVLIRAQTTLESRIPILTAVDQQPRSLG